MKNIFRLFVLLVAIFGGFFSYGADILADDTPRAKESDELQLVDSVVVAGVVPPVKFINEVTVTTKTVEYYVYSDTVFSRFEADHAGQLLGFHVVVNDRTVYEWHRTEGVVEKPGNLLTNLSQWQTFFLEKVVFKPFSFRAEKSLLYVFEKPMVFVGWAPSQRMDKAVFKPEDTLLAVTLESGKFIFSFPKTNSFYLGMKDGCFVPLAKNGERWSIILEETPLEKDELFE